MAKLKPSKNPKISEAQALTILEWLHGRSGLSAKDMTKEDRGYAEAILVEMINGSFQMGLIEALLRAAIKLPGGPKKVIIQFLKGVGKTLVKYKDKDDLDKMIKEPVIYKTIYNTVKVKTKSMWAIRVQTGEW